MVTKVSNPLTQIRQTADELSAGVSPTYSYYRPGDVRRTGAVGDGVTDDTAAIQETMDSNDVVRFPMTDGGGIYMVDAQAIGGTQGVQVKSNTTVEIDTGVEVKAMDTASAAISSVFYLALATDNVTFCGGGRVTGERVEHTGSTGEFGMGMYILGSSNVRINDLIITDCWGDGVYVSNRTDSPYTPSTNIHIHNVAFSNNRRNNLSVVGADGVYITQSHFTNANGIAPENGIDLEPNTNGVVRNVSISNCFFEDNVAEGCRVEGTNGVVASVSITGCTFEGNNSGDTATKGQLTARGASAEEVSITGNLFRESNDGPADIFIEDMFQFSITGNVIYGLGDQSGIEVDNCQIGTVTGNIVRSTGRHGIRLLDSSEITVGSNHIRTVGLTTDVTYDGISLENADNCIISGNNIIRAGSGNTQAYGIDIDANSGSAVITGNKLTSAGLTGNLRDSGGSTTLHGNAGYNVELGADAANTNTPSGSTSDQLAVYDSAGTLLGYVPVYAAPW